MRFSAGQPETLCGAGSMLENTTEIRAWLPVVLRELGVQVLLDAPCGDFNWMAHADLSGIDYVGVDYDAEHLSIANERLPALSEYAPKSKRLIEMDIVYDPLPHADAMLCREFLQHLPNEQVCKVIKNFLASRTEWFLSTSHNNVVNTDIPVAGMFRPLNLCQPPFNFSSPRRAVGDQPSSTRILGLWHRSDFE